MVFDKVRASIGIGCSARVAESPRNLGCMKAAPNPSQPEPHPPLARDQHGNLLQIPDGTCAWRVCRHTGGRPRVVNGPDGQPLRLPLQLTSEDLAEMCGADNYRVYAIDEFGNVLGHVTTVDAGVERQAEPELPMFRNLGLPVVSSDLRFALEAIAGMARTNSEAMRAIAESQADWIKAIAAAKGLPRNLALPPPPPPDYSDDEEDEPPPPKNEGGVDVFLGAVAPFLPNLVSSWSGKNKQSNDTNAMTHLARIRSVLTAIERTCLDEVLTDPEVGEAFANDLASKTVEDAVLTIRHGVKKTQSNTRRPISMNDPILMEKVTAVALLLQTEERVRLMKLAPRIMNSPEAQNLVSELLPLSNEAAAKWLRAHLDELEARFAS